MSHRNTNASKQAAYAVMYGSDRKIGDVSAYKDTRVFARKIKLKEEKPFESLTALLTAAGEKYKAIEYQERLRNIEPILKALRELDKRGEI